MGYRSTVAFCLDIKEPEKFVALLKTKDDIVINEILDHCYDVEGLIHFYADHWKWYDESEGALRDIVEMAENYDENFALRYARYGEEADDVHEESFGEGGWDLEYPYVMRSMEVGFNVDEAKKLIGE